MSVGRQGCVNFRRAQFEPLNYRLGGPTKGTAAQKSDTYGLSYSCRRVPTRGWPHRRQPQGLASCWQYFRVRLPTLVLGL